MADIVVGQPDAPAHLIIAPQGFHDAFAPYLEHRAAAYETRLVSTESVYASDDTGTYAERIQRFIRDVYRQTDGRLTSVLLVGDDPGPPYTTDSIPTGRFPPNHFAPFGLPADSMYGDMDDNWYPDVAVGRWPVHSFAEAALRVSIQLAYEQQPPDGPSLLAFYASPDHFTEADDTRPSTMPAGRRFDDRTEAVIFKLLESFFYATAKAHIPDDILLDLRYDAGGLGLTRWPTLAAWWNRAFPLFTPDFTAAMNRGAFILTYMGHGSTISLATTEFPDGRSMTSAGFDRLSRSGERPIVNLLACQAGCFAEDTCLGEQLLLHPDGAIAVLGSAAAEPISPIVLYFFGNTMAEFTNATPDAHTLGEVFRYAQYGAFASETLLWRVVQQLPTTLQQKMELRPHLASAAFHHSLQITLLGDPATPWRPRLAERRLPGLYDPRQTMPTPTQSLARRIRLATPGKAPGLDSAHWTGEDWSFVLHVLDYLGVAGNRWLRDRATAAGLAEIFTTLDTLHLPLAHPFPQPGEITVRQGLLRIPVDRIAPLVNVLFDPSDANIKRAIRRYLLDAQVQDGSYLKRYLKEDHQFDLEENARTLRLAFRAFARDHLGVTAHSFSLQDTITVGVRLSAGTLTLYDLDGIVFHTAGRARLAVREIRLDLTGAQRLRVRLEPLD